MGIFDKKRTYSEKELQEELTKALNEQTFDFSQLWVEPDEGGGLMKFVPLISLILELVIMILVIVKK